MIDYSGLYEAMRGNKLEKWTATLPTAVSATLHPSQHGKLPHWLDTLATMPHLTPAGVDLVNGVSVGKTAVLDSTQRQQLETSLRQFHPWRKGPFSLYGIDIDTEWRSDWKWDRLKEKIGRLDNRLILDVGSGNGYYGWRMVGAGARLVIGLDPFLLYVMQYQAIRQLVGEHPNYVLPFGVEALPPNLHAFDVVFSMGVLYHRRSPFDHLITLRDALRPSGQLVLETLVIDGKLGEVLVPEGRYAKMRNVWFIPSVPTLLSWLRKARFQNIELIDVTPTTTSEQRSTNWMTFQSLPDFLDDENGRTVEGYPAPIRAIVTATWYE
ncbi:MAG: tRNA 5-methoxyuridine(34)/uridine 5-oxyacetic acid(34) synthase CmoB [Chloroflexota bacterium]